VGIAEAVQQEDLGADCEYASGDVGLPSFVALCFGEHLHFGLVAANGAAVQESLMRCPLEVVVELVYLGWLEVNEDNQMIVLGVEGLGEGAHHIQALGVDYQDIRFLAEGSGEGVCYANCCLLAIICLHLYLKESDSSNN
jgi:hypothetical protein